MNGYDDDDVTLYLYKYHTLVPETLPIVTCSLTANAAVVVDLISLRKCRSDALWTLI